MLEDPDRMYQGAFVPHCEGGGRPQMITTRLDDSIPREVYDRLIEEADDEIERRALAQRYLDRGRGECVLRLPEVAQVVREALHFYDDKRYSLIDWVVMPNHIHLVYEKPKMPVGKISGDFKSYTATMINRRLGRSGALWQRDFFDRYARDAGHLSNMSFYVLLNPVKAGLVDDPFDWPYSSIHEYREEFKEDLRRWYRQWKDRFWHASL